ncbi:MAG: hypothetical protein FWF01_00220 [Alphaproteobacteria bacterium]|nr:hypothetical protein [Alphaproteobacteria bacterium]
MRVKLYTADTMAQALELMKAELGDSALLVSTQRNLSGQGIRITAAIDDDFDPTQLPQPNAFSKSASDMAEILQNHGVDEAAARKLLSGGDPEARTAREFLFSSAVKGVQFAPLDLSHQPKAVMLIGVSGGGKTLMAAKLAAKVRMNGGKAALISADSVKAGAMGQLQALAEIMGSPFFKARTEAEIARRTQEALKTYDQVIIDTPSFNPLSKKDTGAIAALCAMPKTESVAVIPAGLDPCDLDAHLDLFCAWKVRRAIVTKLDCTARKGTLVKAGTRLALAHFGESVSVVQGLVDATPDGFVGHFFKQ